MWRQRGVASDAMPALTVPSWGTSNLFGLIRRLLRGADLRVRFAQLSAPAGSTYRARRTGRGADPPAGARTMQTALGRHLGGRLGLACVVEDPATTTPESAPSATIAARSITVPPDGWRLDRRLTRARISSSSRIRRDSSPGLERREPSRPGRAARPRSETAGLSVHAGHGGVGSSHTLLRGLLRFLSLLWCIHLAEDAQIKGGPMGMQHEALGRAR